MRCEKNYLPIRISPDYFSGDINAYKEALYKIFKRDLIDKTAMFRGKKVDIIHQQFYEGKERSFWHIVSEGFEDTNRITNSERASGISYIKPLLEDTESCSQYLIWERWHDKSNKYRIYIWCTAVMYMVILEDRDTFYKLITAYNVDEHRRKSYLKQYQQYIKTKTPT